MKDFFLSVIFSSRNDHYPQGRGLTLLQFAIDDLFKNLKNIDLLFEIIIVDYNPPTKKKKLIDILKIKKTKNIIVKYIEVPSKIHNKLQYSKYFPVCQELAFNIGIQRSSGKFILTKNADTILSNDFYSKLKNKNFHDDFLYRCSRIDFSFKTFLKKDFKIGDGAKLLENKSCGDFLLMSRKNWFKIRGWWENNEAYTDGSDGLVMVSAKKMEVKEYFSNTFFIYKPKHDLLYEQRTQYHYNKLENPMFDILFSLLKKLLIRLSILQRKAVIISRDGSKTKILMNIYCYDLTRKIINNKIFLPLNKNENWGLKNKKLLIKTIK